MKIWEEIKIIFSLTSNNELKYKKIFNILSMFYCILILLNKNNGKNRFYNFEFGVK